MEVTIQPYTSEHQELIYQWIDRNGEESNLLNVTHAYSAIHQTNLAGVIFVWKSKFHPYCNYFKILLNPLNETDQIAEKLLVKLQNTIQQNLPLQTSIWQTNSLLKGFYERNGFIEIRRTYMPIVRIADVKAAPVSIMNRHLQIQTLKELSAKANLRKKLIRLVSNVYEQTHWANPVALLEFDKWEKLIFSEDVIQKGSFIYLDDDNEEIIAYSFLHTHERDDTVELGWCGALNKNRIVVIPELVLLQINYADEQGYTYLTGEFDSTSPYASEVLQIIPFPPCPAWITFQKKL